MKQLVDNQMKSSDVTTWSFSKAKRILQTEMEKSAAYNK